MTAAATLDQANATLRAAVKQRLGNTPSDDPKMVGYAHSPTESCCEGQRTVVSASWDNAEAARSDCERQLRGDSLLRDQGGNYSQWEPAFAEQPPAVKTLHDAIAAVRDRHGKYGPPSEHFSRTASLVNAAFGTTFTAADWALVMVLDKIARQLGNGQQTDDAAVDIAGYAACHQECRCG
jgi:hypothetical protein